MQPPTRRRRAVPPVSCEPAADSIESELWVRNADSPLLRLPAELRNRIYALVLGIGQIHIRYRPWRHRQLDHDDRDDCGRCDDAQDRKGRKDRDSRHQNGSQNISQNGNQNCDQNCNRNRHQNRHPTHKHDGDVARSASRFYPVALDEHQDAWDLCAAGRRAGRRLHHKNTTALAPAPCPLAHALTPLSAVCRQLYGETAALPFSLNAWSFESTRVMERFLVHERRLTRPQRRAIAVLLIAPGDDLPSRAVERFLGGLRAVLWTDASTATRQRWDLVAAAELRRLTTETANASAYGAALGPVSLSSRARTALRLYE